ncbi:Protein ASC1 [Entamoeba marina]
MKIVSPPVLASKWDKSFFYQLLVITVVVIVAVPLCFGITKQYSVMPIPYPTDLLPSIISLAFFSLLRIVLAQNLFIKLGEKVVVNKPEWTPEFRKFRVDRFGITLFKFFYYMCITPLCIFLFRNEDWMPAALFGKGKSDLSLLWENFPYVPPVPFLVGYYCLELGYHFHSLIFHVCSEPRNDYYDTLLHHVVTIFLIMFSYVNNCGRIGILVMALHNIVDAIMYGAKCTNDLKNQIPCNVACVMLAISYLQYRLWVFPRYVLPAAIDAKNYIPDNAKGGFVIYALLVGMLFCLLGLHMYWYMLIIDMIKKVVTKKGVVDPHAKQEQTSNQI